MFINIYSSFGYGLPPKLWCLPRITLRKNIPFLKVEYIFTQMLSQLRSFLAHCHVYQLDTCCIFDHNIYILKCLFTAKTILGFFISRSWIWRTVWTSPPFQRHIHWLSCVVWCTVSCVETWWSLHGRQSSHDYTLLSWSTCWPVTSLWTVPRLMYSPSHCAGCTPPLMTTTGLVYKYSVFLNIFVSCSD